MGQPKNAISSNSEAGAQFSLSGGEKKQAHNSVFLPREKNPHIASVVRGVWLTC